MSHADQMKRRQNRAREVMDLRRSGLKLRQIGDRMGLSLESVRVTVRRAVQVDLRAQKEKEFRHELRMAQALCDLRIATLGARGMIQWVSSLGFHAGHCALDAPPRLP